MTIPIGTLVTLTLYSIYITLLHLHFIGRAQKKIYEQACRIRELEKRELLLECTLELEGITPPKHVPGDQYKGSDATK